MRMLLSLTMLLALPLAGAAEEKRAMLIVVGEPGEPRYEADFRKQAEAWKELAGRGDFGTTVIGLDEVKPEGDRPLLEKSLAETPKEGGDFWLVWIGHGSFDGRTANFNLRGRDVSAGDLKGLLQPFGRRLVILNLFSASSPFLPELSADNRVIVGSTRSEGERNYARFGGAMAEALSAADADLDRDGALSLIEATLFASSKVRAFYEDAQRVMQEHAVIDDNGDGKGTPAESFKGLRAGKNSADGMTARDVYFLKATVDPLSPEAREKRAALEAEIEALREKKKNLKEDEYYRQLEVLMRKMAGLYGR